jgi:hypothetical protein
MGALLGFAFSPLGRWFVMGFAVLALVGGVYLKGRFAGVASEKAKQAEETLNNLLDRNRTDETVNKLPTPDLDRELNRWMLPD